MDFCYSHEAFLPHNCSFAIYYFIISLPISLSLFLSLSPFSIPFLCQNKKDWTTGDLQISLDRWRLVSSASWLSRPSSTRFFFGSLFGFSLTGPLSFSLLSHWLPRPNLTWPTTVQKPPLQLNLTLSPLD